MMAKKIMVQFLCVSGECVAWTRYERHDCFITRQPLASAHSISHRRALASKTSGMMEKGRDIGVHKSGRRGTAAVVGGGGGGSGRVISGGRRRPACGIIGAVRGPAK